MRFIGNALARGLGRLFLSLGQRLLRTAGGEACTASIGEAAPALATGAVQDVPETAQRPWFGRGVSLAQRFPSVSWGVLGGVPVGAGLGGWIGGVGVAALGGAVGIGVVTFALIGAIIGPCVARWSRVELAQRKARRTPPAAS
jgi:hypothetical protein